MSGSLALIKNSKEYWDFIRDLRNNKQVKQGFIQQDNITKKEPSRDSSPIPGVWHWNFYDK